MDRERKYLSLTSDAAAARLELARFLTSKRKGLERAEFGLPPTRRGAVRGLRREEVAVHADVSLTWYTWIEQGRTINPSDQVMVAICKAMRLNAAETAHVMDLAGLRAPRQTHAHMPACPENVQRLIKELSFPTYCIDGRWTIVAWNDSYEAFYPPISTLEPKQRNLLWTTFCDSYVAAMLSDLKDYQERIVGEFRAHAGAMVHTDNFQELIAELQHDSTFRRIWGTGVVRRFASRVRQFNHPVVGLLTLEQHQMSVPSEDGEFQVIIYTPVAATPSRERLEALLQRG